MDNPKHFGLNEKEVAISKEKYGTNRMTKKKRKPIAISFLENLGDPVIRVLIISLVINVMFTIKNIDWFETGGIIVAILLATSISTLSERSSLVAFEKLNESTKTYTRVRRNGVVERMNSEELVVGDVVLLQAGDKVCADGYLLSGALSLDQSAITGESKESAKTPLISEEKLDLSPSSPHSCLGGCIVASGEGEMIIRHVGDDSFLGKIVRELQEEKRESPLKIRLNKLAKQISVLGYGAAVFITVLSLFSSLVIQSDFTREVIISKITDIPYLISEILHSITLGLTVVIMAVPEGLPMMIAVVLSSNVKKMLSDNVLVRKQAGIEAAGSMNILFTDKTGTLTKGKMNVEGFILPDGSIINGVKSFKSSYPERYQSFCENALYNSSAIISNNQIIGGNFTEHALIESIKDRAPLDYSSVTQKIPFDSKNKYSMAEYKGNVYIKGAPDVILPNADQKSFQKSSVEYAISSVQRQGKRVIAMTQSDSFVCATIISDPVRREAYPSIETLRVAGISTVMITGDGILTAKSIAEKVGIIHGKHNVCLTHEELDGMTDSEIKLVLPRLALIARALPQDKSRLVRIAQSMELVVGMTGDGINDAPALKLSDVGFAMGDGADVAKEAGDVVILDNNLASIVKAVLYGRNIFKSIRKFLVFQLTMNFSSALVCMIAPLMGFDTPITVSQMLWVNMIMDTLGGIAFAGEAPQKRIMKEKPKRRDEPILNKYMIHQILISGGFSVLVSLMFLKAPFMVGHIRESENDLVLLSAFFGLFIFLGVMQCINSRTDRLDLFNGLDKNPTFVFIMILISLIQVSFIYFGGSILRATPLLKEELLFTVCCASLAIPAEILRKILWRFSGHSEGF